MGRVMDGLDNLIVAVLKREGREVSTANLGKLLAREGRMVSQPTLSRRLIALNAGRHVASRAAGRGLVHSHDNYHDWFAAAPQRRPNVAYDGALLRSYEPNRTVWLSREELGRLHGAGGGRKLDGSTYARAIVQKLLVDLSYASSALEGNSYSYLDTQVLIEFGLAAEGKNAFETQMILNHKEAILYIVNNIADIAIDARELKTLHALLSRGLLRDPAATGAVRHRVVDITGSSYKPMANPHLLEEELREVARKASEIEEPFEQSLFLMAFVSYLQAFEDVNKRTARLACNVPLLRNSIAPLSFMEMDKTAYTRGLLSLYELQRPDVLKDAFVDGYARSASLYDAYTARDREAMELEVRRGRDIYAAVGAYVRKAVEDGRLPDLAAFSGEHFHHDAEPTRTRLVERVSTIVGALHEGNHVAFGVPRAMFDSYEALRSASEAN